MSVIHLEFLSQSLRKITPVTVVIPNDLEPEDQAGNSCYEREMKTLYLLHGYTGNENDWLRGTTLELLCKKYNIAAVCPSCDNSFYTDRDMTGGKYGTYVGEELVQFIRKLFGFSERKEDTFIGGLSMGGFGAVRCGLKYHQTFGKIVAFSAAFILYQIMGEVQEKGSITDDLLVNKAYKENIFGAPETLRTSEGNPEYLVERMQEEHIEIPDMYLTIGTSDFLLENNRSFYNFLREREVPVTYMESEGTHNWEFWNKQLEPAILWLLNEQGKEDSMAITLPHDQRKNCVANGAAKG